MDLDHEIRDGKLELVRPQPSGIIARCEPVTHAEEEKDVCGLADEERATFEERRRERRMPDALAIEERHHRWHAATLIRLARYIDIALAGLFERKADKFAAPLNCRPIVQLISHDDQRSAACWSISRHRLLTIA